MAEAHLGKSSLQAKIEGSIREGRLKRIQEILNTEDHATKNKQKRKPNWKEDLAYVLKGGGNAMPVSVICDLLVEDTSAKKTYAFELKAPLPNSDQTKVSKEKLLKLMAMENHPVSQAYFALVYNPFGTRDNYSWSYPKRWFDFDNDKSLLVGDELWNFLGGQGTYQKFIDEVNKLGIKYKDIIYRDYLHIEPIESILNNTLK